MSHLKFIKKQAKQLYKDWKSHTEIEGTNGFVAYHYNPKFFNIDNLFFYYELSPDDEKKFSLMKAQHMVAQMVGYTKWTELIQATDKELELAAILLKHFKDVGCIKAWEYAFDYRGMEEMDINSQIKYAKSFFNSEDFIFFADLSCSGGYDSDMDNLYMSEYDWW